MLLLVIWCLLNYDHIDRPHCRNVIIRSSGTDFSVLQRTLESIGTMAYKLQLSSSWFSNHFNHCSTCGTTQLQNTLAIRTINTLDSNSMRDIVSRRTLMGRLVSIQERLSKLEPWGQGFFQKRRRYKQLSLL